MKRGGKILAVLVVNAHSCMHGVAVAEQPVAGLQMVGALIDPVFDLAFQN